MKTLDQMNNVERARLLHSLFPMEIPALLRLVDDLSDNLHTFQDENRNNWSTEQLFPYDKWLDFATDTRQRIKKYGDKLAKSRSLFSDQLFNGLNAVYMAHCLSVYANIRKNQHPKFKLAVELLFSY